MSTKPTPILDEETDAEMAETAETTWVGVKGFSIYIKKSPDGVIVDIYAKGAEDCDSLAGCYAYDIDAQFARDESERQDAE
jgi:hypothetical protein